MAQRKIFFTDMIIEVAIPALIIGLIWTLVSFTINVNSVFNPGGEGLLKRNFFLYVMGTVLINRISGYYRESAKAAMYTILLVGVMSLFALQYSGSFGYIFGGKGAGGAALANLALVLVVGLASYKIARESCLDIRETEIKEKSAIQLRTEVRAKRDWYHREEIAERQEAEKAEAEKKKAEEAAAPPPRVPQRHPGAWIIYFSLFSMLVFAAGQRLLPEDDGQLYAGTFAYLVANLVCALALLSLISFSSIRQQSWEKKALVKPGVGWFWILAGAALIVVVISLSTLPPRPVPDYLVRSATPRILPALDEEEPAPESERDSGTSTTWGGLRKQRQLEEAKYARDMEKYKEQAEGRDEDPEGGGDEDSPDGGGWGSGGEEAGDSKQGKSADGEKGSGKESGGGKGSKTSASGARAMRAPTPTPPLGGLATLGKIIAIIIVALAAIWALIFILGALGKANPFRKLSARLKSFRERMRSLLGGKKRKRLKGAKLQAALREQNLYMENPFRNRGMLAGMSKEELVSYTYKAYENYFHTQGHTPSKDQTPAEFLQSLPEDLREDEFSSLVKLFMLAEYSTREISDKNIKQLKKTWRKIEA
jgi:hypothetical protein